MLKLLGFTTPVRPWPPFSRSPQNSLAKPSDMLASVKPDWDGNHLPGPAGTIWDHLGQSGTIWNHLGPQNTLINCHQLHHPIATSLVPSLAAAHIGKALVLIPPRYAVAMPSEVIMEHRCIRKISDMKRQSKHILVGGIPTPLKKLHNQLG